MGVPFRKYAGAIRHRRGVPVIANGQVMQAGFTFTNANTRTYFDASGLLQTASANEARTTYIDGVPYLWMDGAVEEISGRSDDIPNWDNVTDAAAVKDAVGMDGEANTGTTVTDSSGAANQRRKGRFSITDDTEDYWFPFAVKKEASPSTYPRIMLTLEGGSTLPQQDVIIDLSDGSFVEFRSDGWVVGPYEIGEFYHYAMGLTNNNTGNVNAGLHIWPSWNTTGGTAGENAAQGSCVMGWGGLFKTDWSLMPILTTGGTTASIAADVASLTNSIIAGLVEGTIYAEVWMPALASDAARHIAELESDANNFIRVQHSADGDLDAQITDGGASQATLAGTDLTVGTLQKVALTFKANEFSLYRGGTRLATDTSGTVPSFDTLLIGAGLFGGIRAMNIYPYWPQAMAEARTT